MLLSMGIADEVETQSLYIFHLIMPLKITSKNLNPFSCINEYLAIDGGGHMCMNAIVFEQKLQRDAECFREKLSLCRDK